MEAIPLHRVAVVLPFAHYLSGIGAPVERGFRHAGLPVAALDHVDHYVPSERFWAFVGYMSRHEGIDDLGFRVGKHYGANCADPHLSDHLCQSPTLFHALKQAIALVNSSISRNRIGLCAEPQGDRVQFFHQASFSADHPYIDQIEWFGLMALLGMVRLFTGPEWQPATIGLTSRHPPGPYIRARLPDTRILTAQQVGYLSLDHSLLSLPPFNCATDMSSATPILAESVTTDFVTSLKQVLQTYIQERDLSIEFAAELCNTSKRSLQRKLTEANTRYSEVLDCVRFDVASEMLQNAEIKVTDIAHQLGYSDSAHFSRAFRRVSGVNPRAYRQAYTN